MMSSRSVAVDVRDAECCDDGVGQLDRRRPDRSLQHPVDAVDDAEPDAVGLVVDHDDLVDPVAVDVGQTHRRRCRGDQPALAVSGEGAALAQVDPQPGLEVGAALVAVVERHDVVGAVTVDVAEPERLTVAVLLEAQRQRRIGERGAVEARGEDVDAAAVVGDQRGEQQVVDAVAVEVADVGEEVAVAGVGELGVDGPRRR